MRTTRQDALFAAAAFAGGLVMHLAGDYANWPDWPDIALGWRLLPLLAVCVAMLFRRTAPMAALAVAAPAVILDGVFGSSFSTVAIFTDSLYAAALYGPKAALRWLLAVIAAATAALAVVASLTVGALVTGAVLAVILVSPVLTGALVRQHRDHADAERQNAEQVARLAEMDREQAVVAERARMARELHDVIANHLSAVALHSSAVLSRDLDPAAVRQALQVIRENSVQGLAEMRRMIGLLRDSGSDIDPGAARPRLDDIKTLVERAERPGLTVRLTAGDSVELPTAVELAAYRIVQESLTNVFKHAGDGEASVTVEHTADRVAIAVDSPLGTGTDPFAPRLPGAGSGLIGMRERATLLGGTFAAGPSTGRWQVRAELPLESE